MRGVESIRCSCGGEVVEKEPTEEEEKKYGCGTPGCCVEAFQCTECLTRFTFSLDAPEME